MPKAETFVITTGLVGLEPTTYSLGGGRSIQLSYNPKEKFRLSQAIIILLITLVGKVLGRSLILCDRESLLIILMIFGRIKINFRSCLGLAQRKNA